MLTCAFQCCMVSSCAGVDVYEYWNMCVCVCVCVLASEQMTRAFSLSLAALLGEDVYNFGELVSETHTCIGNL